MSHYPQRQKSNRCNYAKRKDEKESKIKNVTEEITHEKAHLDATHQVADLRESNSALTNVNIEYFKKESLQRHCEEIEEELKYQTGLLTGNGLSMSSVKHRTAFHGRPTLNENVMKEKDRVTEGSIEMKHSVESMMILMDEKEEEISRLKCCLALEQARTNRAQQCALADNNTLEKENQNFRLELKKREEQMKNMEIMLQENCQEKEKLKKINQDLVSGNQNIHKEKYRIQESQHVHDKSVLNDKSIIRNLKREKDLLKKRLSVANTTMDTLGNVVDGLQLEKEQVMKKKDAAENKLKEILPKFKSATKSKAKKLHLRALSHEQCSACREKRKTLEYLKHVLKTDKTFPLSAD